MSIPGRAYIGLLTGLALLAIVAAISIQASADDDVWYPTELREVQTWEDPTGNTSAVKFEYSHDGSRIALVTYGKAPRVRVVDRDLQRESILDLDYDVTFPIQARWSDTDQWIAVAWNHSQGGPDRLTLFDASTLEPFELFENDTTPLLRFQNLIFVAQDEVLVLAGWDENHTSRMLVIETRTLHLLNDIEWRDNETVTLLGYDTNSVQCIDYSGTLSILDTNDWTVSRHSKEVESVPTSLAVTPMALGHPWSIGYYNGRVAHYHGYPRNESFASIDSAPIQGLAWVWKVPMYYVTGVNYASIDGGEHVQAKLTVYRFSDDTNNSFKASSTMFIDDVGLMWMAPDPLVEGQFGIGFYNGTFAVWDLVIRENLPPTVLIETPEEGQEIRGIYVAGGRTFDDWNRTRWVKVRIDGRNWFEAWGTDTWTYQFDISDFGPGEHTLSAQAYDGIHMSEVTKVKFNIAERPRGDEWPTGIPQIPMVLIVLVLAFVLMVRAYRRKWGA